ncbi:MAG: hypothetical protein J7M25_11560 [Deltaproteobacteria bacterium]|nr:hypothetical protein [Deltaproteobacteria bacterium]
MRRMPSIRLFAILFALTFGACSTGPDYETLQQGLSVCADGDVLYGIDVSHWQGVVDWDRVAADGVTFAFMRVSDGTRVLDSQFSRNWSETRRVGIIRGAYQFFRPKQDPEGQADVLIDALGGTVTPGDLPPVIDVEVSDGLSRSTVTTRIQRWVDRVESRLHVAPIVYTSPGLWSSISGSDDFENLALWVAHYRVTCPRMPWPWTQWAFHQYSDRESVNGISGKVDGDKFNGTLADLQALTGASFECGNGDCEAGESATTCPDDCSPCATIPEDGRIVDETDACFEPGGDPRWLRSENSGWNDNLLWTHAVSSKCYNYGVWHLRMRQTARYRVEVYLAAPWGETRHAKYQIRHAGVTDVVEMDQTAYDGWATLGEFDFAIGGGQWVRLEDLTGESLSDELRVVFDAVRLTYMGPAQSGYGGVGDNQQLDPDQDRAAGAGVDDGAGDGQFVGGCSMASSQPSRLPLGILIALALGLAWSRRRGNGERRYR